jgi:hypothetical protein
MAEPRARRAAGRPRKPAARKATESVNSADSVGGGGEFEAVPVPKDSRVEASASVRAYLEELMRSPARRGRRRDPSRLRHELESIDARLPTLSALRRLRLLQRRVECVAELERLERSSPIDELEERFVKVAAHYGERNGISYAAWRGFGVPASVLARAGITDHPQIPGTSRTRTARRKPRT